MEELTESSPVPQEELLAVDFFAREQLFEAARWANFLAIMGFIGCAIIVIAGIIMGVFYSVMNHLPTRYDYSGRSIGTGKSGFIGVTYVIAAVLFFFRCLYLYRFANKMKSGLHKLSQDEVNESFQNLKKMFRYNGIMTIVVISLYIIILFALIITALNR